jgi:Methyltransferase domain.
MNCNLCNGERLQELGYVGIKLSSITSEPKLCELPAKIYYCPECCQLQKVYSEIELSAIDLMYQSYDAYKVSSGNEQLIFAGDSHFKTRSYQALEKCIDSLTETGKLLDIGTGNGTALKVSSKLLPNWQLFAFDINDKYKDSVLKIPGVVDFYAGNFFDIPAQKFDLIILWHSLEHIDKPTEYLANLKDYLTDNGQILLQVPDVQRQPFDLAVIDHCSHFTSFTLNKLCQSAGFTVIIDGQDWTHNCLTLLLKPSGALDVNDSYLNLNSFSPDTCFHWLNYAVQEFAQSVQGSNYAIFGTSIAGIWLSSQLEKPPIYFIDEDQSRSGNKIGNIPIITPQYLNLDSDIDIVMAFTHKTGQNISLRLKEQYINCRASRWILSSPFVQ